MPLALSELQAARMDKAMNPVPASPEFVLDVLRANHRHQCSFDPEADPFAELTFDTTVAEWRDACDLVGTQRLAEALNEDWGVAIPLADWKRVLEPPKSRTLRDVCELVASHGMQTEVLSVGHLGTSSRAAGAFLAIRSLLVRAGADAATIKPSLPIGEVTRRFPSVFLGPISRLAPSKLPTVVIRTPVYHVAMAAFGVGLLGLMGLGAADWFGLAHRRAELGALFAVVAGLGYIGTWIVAHFIGPAEVRFGTIVTFRDLAEAIAGERTHPLDDAGIQVVRCFRPALGSRAALMRRRR